MPLSTVGWLMSVPVSVRSGQRGLLALGHRPWSRSRSRGEVASHSSPRPMTLFPAEPAGFIAMLCYFWALGTVPIATASALLYTNPIFVVIRR